jgi:hypothetical protein
MLRNAGVIALVAIVSLAPVAHAQQATPSATRTPDPAQIALSTQDVSGWTATGGIRDETWDIGNLAGAPNVAGDAYTYDTDFTRDAADGHQLVLTTQATEASADAAQQQFRALQHDALGQTSVALPSGMGDQSVGWWETAGDQRSATAATLLANMILQVRVTGVLASDNLSDAQVAGWLSRMVDRANAAPDAAAFDWTQVMPDQPGPWRLILDSVAVGGDWQPQSGLELVAHDLGGQVQSVSASRDFTHTGVVRRTLTSAATVFNSATNAMAQMTGPGDAITAPALGDQSAEFKETDSNEANEAPTVTYTIDVRHGAIVSTTQETGVLYSLQSPAETEALATTADARVPAQS